MLASPCVAVCGTGDERARRTNVVGDNHKAIVRVSVRSKTTPPPKGQLLFRGFDVSVVSPRYARFNLGGSCPISMRLPVCPANLDYLAGRFPSDFITFEQIRDLDGQGDCLVVATLHPTVACDLTSGLGVGDGVST